MRLDQIMPVLKKVNSVPQTQLKKNIVNAIQFSNSDIKNVFFPTALPDVYLNYNSSVAQNSLNELAIKYLTYIISKDTTRSFNSTVCNISIGTIQEWFADNGTSIGLWMMIDYLLYNLNLSPILSSVDESLTELVNNGKEASFVNGFLVECDTAGSFIPAKMFLNLINVLDNTGNSIKLVLPTWQAQIRWPQVQDYNTVNWLSTVVAQFGQDGDAFTTVKEGVDRSISAKTGPYSYTTRECIDTGPTGAPIIGNVTHKRYEYGEGVWNWINSCKGPSVYSMKSGNSPDNFEEEHSGSSGCVLKNTFIRMYDGTTKLIQDIKPGDMVINGLGTLSVCSKEKVYNPYVKKMYSINDDRVFMSLEHALMTDRGWCSLNPKLAMEINPEIKVYRLEVGDRVWKFNFFVNGNLQIEKVVIHKINIQNSEDMGFEGYDLHFSEGYHSYFANDYLCFLSYPEITTANILSNMKKNMTVSERMKFFELINQNESMFRKVFGNAAIDSLYIKSIKGD